MSETCHITRIAAMSREDLEQHALWLTGRLESISGLTRAELAAREYQRGFDAGRKSTSTAQPDLFGGAA